MVEKYKLIGEILKEAGFLKEEQIQEALNIQRSSKRRLSEILFGLGYITTKNITEILESQFGILPQDVIAADIPYDIINKVPADIALYNRIAPIKYEDEILTIATDDPFNFLAQENFEVFLGCKVKAILTRPTGLSNLLDKFYALKERPVAAFVEELDQINILPPQGKELPPPTEEEAPIIKLVDMLIRDAIKNRASDIHIEPLEKKFRVRYRIDGILYEVPSAPKQLQGPLISRVKLMAGMDIAEKRLPQDGRIKIAYKAKEIDLRVSSLPALHGESIVLRILDRSRFLLGLEDLGFLADHLEKFKNILNLPNGIILVTGPTGCGKTTTLYAALGYINKPNKKLITIEDPVEYQIHGINQVQIKPHIGLTFAAGLRTMMRQAPDIIMVGEIRDYETASVAIQAAMTGHLIFSTLHTNDAPGAVTRLIDMGIAPYLVSSTVQAILAQRLIRTVCNSCKQPYNHTEDELSSVNPKDMDSLKDVAFYQGKGCNECNQTGFKGRTAIFELLVITDAIRDLIFKKAQSTQLSMLARKLGMRTLREDGIKRAMLGFTTIKEVIRVTQADIE